MAGFYSKDRVVSGVRIRAHAVVSDAALDVAEARIARLLAGCPAVRANLLEAEAELHVVGKDQAVSDLPMYRHLAGVPMADGRTIDARRGYGGLHAVVSEESLLCLPTARHRDHRDICSHEVAHTVLAFGVDDAVRASFEARHAALVDEGRWEGAYARTNVHELFAEATMWYVGSRGDHGRIHPAPEEGPDWLRAHDPDTFALLDDLYRGRTAPAAIRWNDLRPEDTDRSGLDQRPTTVVFANRTDRAVERLWLDFDGEARPYGTVPAGGVVCQETYESHAWRIGARVWVAGPGPCRITIRRSGGRRTGR